MRILISGGGLAGLTLAYWLHQYKFTPVVIEQAEGIRHSGYGIDFFNTGYDVAERMGLIDWLDSQKIPAQFVAYVSQAGKIIAELPMTLMEKVANNKYMALMHWTLEEGLYQTVADNVEIRFGCSLTSVEQTTKEVTVTFDQGQTETFDLLICADGIHSNTRRLVFGPEKQFGNYLGYYVASYALEDEYGIGHSWQNYTEPKRQVGAYCSHKEGQIITFLMYQASYEGSIPHEERLSRLRRAFNGMGWLTPQLQDHAPDGKEIFMDTVTQIQMPTWHRNRVALVGDAAYCLTLISGQGASMAMGGAYLLAQALQEKPNYLDAFRSYEDQLRPYIENRQKNARDFAKFFIPGSQLRLALQKIIMKIVLRESFTGLLRQQFGVESILKQEKANQ